MVVEYDWCCSIEMGEIERIFENKMHRSEKRIGWIETDMAVILMSWE
jgi:hypothetical protein